MRTAVLLDAGGVLLNEGEYESLTAQAIVEVLSGRVPGYCEE